MAYQLVLFAPPPLSLTAEIETEFVDSNEILSLFLKYKFNGNLKKVDLFTNLLNLSNNEIPLKHRAQELWKTTCLECFIKTSMNKSYWEFNLSPLGQWNFYELESYRLNLKESDLCHPVQFTSNSSGEDQLILSVQIKMNLLIQKHPDILTEGFLSVTNVIRWESGETSYLALKHPQEKPDFHNKEGFIIPLPQILKKGE